MKLLETVGSFCPEVATKESYSSECLVKITIPRLRIQKFHCWNNISDKLFHKSYKIWGCL